MTKSFLITSSFLVMFALVNTPASAEWGKNKDGTGGYGGTPGTSSTTPSRPPQTRPPKTSSSDFCGYGGVKCPPKRPPIVYYPPKRRPPIVEYDCREGYGGCGPRRPPVVYDYPPRRPPIYRPPVVTEYPPSRGPGGGPYLPPNRRPPQTSDGGWQTGTTGTGTWGSPSNPGYGGRP